MALCGFFLDLSLFFSDVPTTGLDVNTLGTIWMEVDNERRGKIDFDQLCLILGLISQAQNGTIGEKESPSNFALPSLLSPHTSHTPYSPHCLLFSFLLQGKTPIS